MDAIACKFTTHRLEDLLDDGGLDLGGLEVVGELLEGVLLGREVGLLPHLNVVVAGVPEDLLGDLTSDEASTAGGGDETNAAGATLAVHLARDGVGGTNLVTPVATHDGNHVGLC